MSFGGEFQGMTDREILVDLAGKVKGAALMNKAQYDALAVKVDAIRCPSPKCAVHDKELGEMDNRVQTLESLAACNEKAKDNRLIIWGLVISAIAGWGGLIIAMADIVTRGG